MVDALLGSMAAMMGKKKEATEAFKVMEQKMKAQYGVKSLDELYDNDYKKMFSSQRTSIKK